MSVTGWHQSYLTVIYTTVTFDKYCWKAGSPQLVAFSPVSALANTLHHIIVLYQGRLTTVSMAPDLLWTAFPRLLKHYDEEGE